MKHGGECEEFTVQFPYFLWKSLFAKRNLFASFMVDESTNNTGALHARTHTHTHTSKNRTTESETWKQTEEKK
jgi:hypothetical protein